METLEQWQSEQVALRMKIFSGNVSAVAKSLGINRRTVYKIIEANKGE
jgi:transcriptional regulator of acetoin/glycerol metabolism